jgi:adenylate cyclase
MRVVTRLASEVIARSPPIDILMDAGLSPDCDAHFMPDRPLPQTHFQWLRPLTRFFARPGWLSWRDGVAIALLVALLVLVCRGLGWLQVWEWSTFDELVRLRPARLDNRVVLVTVTEADLRLLRQWPMSDDVLADVLETLEEYEPRTIGLDLVRDFPVPPGSERLKQVMRESQRLVGIRKVGGEGIAPPPVLAEKPGAIGASDLLLDRDRKVRRAVLSLADERDLTVFGLGTQVALNYLQALPQPISLEAIDEAAGIYRLGKATIRPFEGNDGAYINAIDDGYQVLIDYQGLGCTLDQSINCGFRSYSLNDVLQRRVPLDALRDRLVLVGIVAESLGDRFYTPYSNTADGPQLTSGIEIHASIARQLIRAALDGWPMLQVWPDSWEILWIVLWTFYGTVLGWTVRQPMLLWGMTALGMAAVLVCAWQALQWMIWIPLIPPMLGLVGGSFGASLGLAAKERRDRQTITELFERYVTPQVAQVIWQSRHQIVRRGEFIGQKLMATVMFVDLVGFTSLAEAHPPEIVFPWLNEYMQSMTQSVLDRNGIVNKFIGDAIMALFGVPVPQARERQVSEDAIAAVSCAVEMGQRLQHLNQQWRDRGRPTAAIRIGIATGPVMSGCIGSALRLEYTVIGDTVNVAARLESYDKTFDGGLCRIFIEEETYRHVRDRFPTRFIGPVTLKGREHVTNIYQVLLPLRADPSVKPTTSDRHPPMRGTQKG